MHNLESRFANQFVGSSRAQSLHPCCIHENNLPFAMDRDGIGRPLHKLSVPLFRFANLFLQPPPLPPLLRFLLRSNLRAVAAVDERRSPYECSDDKTYQKKCSCKLSVHKTRNLIEWNIDGNDPRDILEGEGSKCWGFPCLFSWEVLDRSLLFCKNLFHIIERNMASHACFIPSAVAVQDHLGVL